jgi:hypothetical protein
MKPKRPALGGAMGNRLPCGNASTERICWWEEYPLLLKGPTILLLSLPPKRKTQTRAL